MAKHGRRKTPGQPPQLATRHDPGAVAGARHGEPGPGSVPWLLWNDLLSTLMRSSTPVAPERRAPSAISPRVGRRNDERSKGASTTSHAAIR